MKKLLIAIAIVALAPLAQATNQNNNHPSWESHNWSQSSWFFHWFKTRWNNSHRGCGRF